MRPCDHRIGLRKRVGLCTSLWKMMVLVSFVALAIWLGLIAERSARYQKKAMDYARREQLWEDSLRHLEKIPEYRHLDSRASPETLIMLELANGHTICVHVREYYRREISRTQRVRRSFQRVARFPWQALSAEALAEEERISRNLSRD